jgi:hypothetical protein
MSQQPLDHHCAAGSWRRRLAGIDVRSLALLRVLMAVVLLADWALRWRDFDAHYADSGMFPLETSRRLFDTSWRWSLHWLSDNPTYQRALFAGAALAAACLLIGWRTRLATLACWIFVVSFWHRNPLVCNYGDTLLRLLLFWSLFLPLGATWSVDAWRRARRQPVSSEPVVVCSIGSTCLLLQLTLFYFFAGLWKWNDDWLGGHALWHALHLEYSVRPTAALLLQWPSLHGPLTQATLALELLGPLVIWLPWRTAAWRIAMIVAFLSLHIGIELCFVPLMLSYVSMVAWAMVVPTCVWESRWLRPLTTRWAEWLQRGSAPPAADSPAAKSPAATAIGKLGRRVATGYCVAAMTLACYWNVATFLSSKVTELVPPVLLEVGYASMVWQTWDMFYEPSRHNGWWVAQARLRDERSVDLLHGDQPFDREHPESHWNEMPNPRWRVLFRRLGDDGLAPCRQAAADYLLRSANAQRAGDQRIERLDLLYVERSAKPASDLPSYRTRMLATAVSDDPPPTDTLRRAFEAFDRDLLGP